MKLFNFFRLFFCFSGIVLSTGCFKSRERPLKHFVAAEKRMCDCFKLLSRDERGFYLQYVDGEDTFYTGKCQLTRSDGSGYKIMYEYLKGHLIDQTETYPTGVLREESCYDTSGFHYDRTDYYPNGQRAYQIIWGDHAYETFYENGSLQRKAGYGFTKEDVGNKYANLYEERLYDSCWKADGSFDSVRHYNKASITY